MGEYILSIDQSTQGTKALLLDEKGKITSKDYLPHKQIIDKKGYISHNPNEIYNNVIAVTKRLINKSNIDKSEVVCIGISNQRETSVVWDKKNGEPIANAIVWQCSRSEDICRYIESLGKSKMISQKTGLHLSSYFPASKYAWLIQNTDGAQAKAKKHKLRFGTIDTWLINKLTGEYETDYSNASRTQLFNIKELKWDNELCLIFGIDVKDLPEVCDSDGLFGYTDFEEYFPNPIPIHSVMGDSHGALFGHGCLDPGTVKATYGTGSSVMMNVGESICQNGKVSSSIAWKTGGKINYVLEGNINYAGAVITWLKDNLGLVKSPEETEGLCLSANQNDALYFVPAFTGIGAPYWNTKAKGMITGITSSTEKADIVRSAVECIAYQIYDVIEKMSEASGIDITQVRTDGGPTKNNYLMQFQSDILNCEIQVPQTEELSAIGVAYAAGLAEGIFGEEVFQTNTYTVYKSIMGDNIRENKIKGWKKAIRSVLARAGGEYD